VKLVMTLTAPGEPTLADAHLSFHLHAGVDQVLVADTALAASTRALLESYARDGCVRLVDVDAGLAGRTQLARLAAREHGADWVIDSTGAEFWWPRGESLKDVLVAIPPRYGIVQALVRDFLERPDGGSFFADRRTIRRSLQAPDAPRDPIESMLRPVYRAHSEIVVGDAGGRVPLRAWYPIELLRFASVAATDQASVDRGLADGLLAVDTRLREALAALRAGEAYARPVQGERRLTLRAPDVVDDAAYAVECAAVGEVDLAALDRHIRELEDRITWLEARLWPRVLRTASRLARRPRS
jgi:hypothetical protein